MARLLERDAELRRLREWSAAAAAGQGRVVFVAGEAGIGKSALLDACAELAVAAGLRVAIGRCDALATPRALGAPIDAVAQLGVDLDADRDRLLAAVVDAARADPVLLAIEDAHWADAGTIDLIGMIGRRVADLALLLVVTYRDDEVDVDHPLRRTIGDLVTGRATTWLGLAPLSAAAVRVLAAGQDVDAEALHARAGGNPFFVTEALAAPGDVVPTTVRLAVLARAARLGRDARRLLDAVSVVPGRAERWLVDALQDAPPGALDECLERGMLVAAGEALTFRHELARLAIEGQLGESARRTLHTRALAALRDRDDVDPARVVHHAEAAGDDTALVLAARAACLDAAARTVHREAVRHGERALALGHLLSADEVAELAVKVAPSLIGVADIDRAIELTRSAVAHWCAAADARREADALVVLCSALMARGRTAESLPPIERAVELLEREPAGPELLAAYDRLTSVHMLERDRDGAARWGARAIDLATELGDDRVRARALIESGIADVLDLRFDGLEQVRAGIELARRAGLPALISLGLGQIGSGCGELRRYDLAVPALRDGVAFATTHQLETGRLYQTAWLGRCELDLGRWADAEARCREVLAGSRTYVYARFVALNTMGWLRARRGDGDAWPLLDEALALARGMQQLQRLWPVAAARAEAAWLDGRLDDHVALVEEVLPMALHYRHGLAAGQLGLWLARAGRLDTAPPGAPPCFARWIEGDHLAAAAAFRAMGCPYEEADARADSPSAPQQREALAAFERLGAAPMAERLARRLGVTRAARRSTDPAVLSAREVEVLRLVAAGFTNPQIATTLYISRKTAEHHVSAILARLGVQRRAEAAAAAVRLGLIEG